MKRWALVSLAGTACVAACGLGTGGAGPPDFEAGASSGNGSSGGATIDAPAGSGSGSGSGSGGGSSSGSGGASGSSSGSASGSSSGSASGSSGSSGGTSPACVDGWTLVLGEMGSTTACPSGYPDAYSGVGNPQVQPGACTCSCNITMQPTCSVGSLAWHYGTQPPACTGASPLYSDGACTPFFAASMLAAAQQVQALPFSGGNCSGQAVGDTTKVQPTPVQTCAVPDASAASVCGGSVPAGFAACLIAPGDVQCPSGSPFSNRTVIGDSKTLVCSACSSCSVTGSCQNPVLSIYSDATCQTVLATIPANGMCVGAKAGSAAAYWYQAQVQAQCAASGTSPSFQATNPQTLCCR